MDTDIKCHLEEGLSVNIKRTDGRVHSALISGIDWDVGSVTVEWFERGETKGKEVEIVAVLALNPDVTIPSRTSERPIDSNGINSILEPHESYRIPRDSSEESEISGADQPDVSKEEADEDDGIVTADLTSATLSVRRSPRSRPSTSRSAVPASGKVISTGQRLKKNQNNVSRDTQQNSPMVFSKLPTQQTNVRPQTPTTATPNPNQNNKSDSYSGRGAPRRSNVVKEVERLKKKREERRLRQAEEKAEKEALMNQDPGNPNWEFSSMIREYQASVECHPLRGIEPVEEHQITVCVRKRPLNRREITRKEIDVIGVPAKDTIIVHEPKNKVDLTKYLENQQFRFDYVFDENCGNDLVYRYTARPLVSTIFDGGMATCFAYGQTGSGKTHTMGGADGGGDCHDGIYAMVTRDVFRRLIDPGHNDLSVSASFFEIYSGKVFDLLADKAKLRVLEDGKGRTQIVGLTEKPVDACEQVLKLIKHGNAARTSGQTSANSNSSRSHAIFQIILRTHGRRRIHGKFSLIDLAGNERGADTSSSDRQTRMEGAEINKSLLALKECVRALGKKGVTHLPFRVSKLTQVLKDSFVGDDSRTCMIAMVSPGMSSCENTLNTLRYADRVKELAVAATTSDSELNVDRRVTDDPPTNTDDSDLGRLRSLNEGDMSADLYIFHEAISQLQSAEDEVLENHKTTMEFMEETHLRASELYELTKDVDYDQDMYSQRWETLLDHQIAILTHARDLVSEFRSRLIDEEKMSQKMKREDRY